MTYIPFCPCCPLIPGKPGAPLIPGKPRRRNHSLHTIAVDWLFYLEIQQVLIVLLHRHFQEGQTKQNSISFTVTIVENKYEYVHWCHIPIHEDQQHLVGQAGQVDHGHHVSLMSICMKVMIRVCSHASPTIDSFVPITHLSFQAGQARTS
jgi:hypothetical protein